MLKVVTTLSLGLYIQLQYKIILFLNWRTILLICYVKYYKTINKLFKLLIKLLHKSVTT